MNTTIAIRDIKDAERTALGDLMVAVYSSLEGFPTPEEQPDYYEMLQNIGQQTQKLNTRVFVALEGERVLGGVVYFSDMKQYG